MIIDYSNSSLKDYLLQMFRQENHLFKKKEKEKAITAPCGAILKKQLIFKNKKKERPPI